MGDCKNCGRKLTADEIALHKKLICRGAKEFLCLTCLSEFYDCKEQLLKEKIEQFRKDGCLLFR